MRSITKLALGLAVVTPVQAMEQHMDAMPVAKLAVDHLEQRFDGDDQALSWELEGTYGNDLHKAVLKSSGERADGGPTDSSETQLLYRRQASEFFDWQAGIRHDDQPGPARSYAVLGLKGLAPQWIEVDAKAGKGVFKSYPARTDLPATINESLVVELYSR